MEVYFRTSRLGDPRCIVCHAVALPVQKVGFQTFPFVGEHYKFTIYITHIHMAYTQTNLYQQKTFQRLCANLKRGPNVSGGQGT